MSVINQLADSSQSQCETSISPSSESESAGIDVEFESIRAELNEIIRPYPKNFKSQLRESLKKLKEILLDRFAVLDLSLVRNVDHDRVIQQIVNEHAQFFQNLRYGYGYHIFEKLDELDSQKAQVEDHELEENEPKDLLNMVEKYLSTLFYDKLFNLTQFTSRFTQQAQLDEALAKYALITPNHLEIPLKEDNDNVRVCMYLAIRSLTKMCSTKSAFGKLDCIFESSKLMLEALSKSLNGKLASADDFLPSMVYIIMKAKVPALLFHVDFISNFIGDKALLESGEKNYYFTSFLCALQVIQGLQVDVQHYEPEHPTFFVTSVEIIQTEVEKLFTARRAELIAMLKANLRKIPLGKKLTSDEKEQRVWKYLKWVPVVNFGYGLIRTPVYAFKGNKEEAIKSALGTLGGIAGVGAGIAGFLVSGPLIVPIMVSMIAGGAANQTVTGGGELIVETAIDPKSFTSLSKDDREKRVYEKVIKDIPLIGLGYSAIRAPVYLGKGKKKEAQSSLINASINLGASGVGVAAGVGMARLVSAFPANAASAVVDAADDIAKPIGMEIVDFVLNQTARVIAAPSFNSAVRFGACNITRMVVENGVPADNYEADLNEIF